MTHIRMIHPHEARGELRFLYEEIRNDMVGWRPVPVASSVWNIMRVFSLQPAFLRAFKNAFLFTMWGGVLRRQAKEALGVTVSRMNQCLY